MAQDFIIEAQNTGEIRVLENVANIDHMGPYLVFMDVKGNPLLIMGPEAPYNYHRADNGLWEDAPED